MNETILNVLAPNADYGDVSTFGNSLLIGTNGRAKTPEQVREQGHTGQDIITSFVPDATTGSYAQWNLPDGDYVVTGQLFSRERSSGGDSFGYWFDDGEYQEILTASDLPNIPGIGKMLDFEITVPVVDGKLTLSVWDTEDNRQSSVWKVDSIAPAPNVADTMDELTNPEPGLEIEQGVTDQILLSGYAPDNGVVEVLIGINNADQLIPSNMEMLQGVWYHSDFDTGLAANIISIDYQSPEELRGYDW